MRPAKIAGFPRTRNHIVGVMTKVLITIPFQLYSNLSRNVHLRFSRKLIVVTGKVGVSKGRAPFMQPHLFHENRHDLNSTQAHSPQPISMLAFSFKNIISFELNY